MPATSTTLVATSAIETVLAIDIGNVSQPNADPSPASTKAQPPKRR